MTITRSPGYATGHGFIAGGGQSGVTAELDSVVAEAAETLAAAYGMPVTIRFNSDRRSGGAWLRTDEPDSIGANAEVGICACIVTAESNARFAARCPDMENNLRDPGIYVQAHVGKRVGEYAHTDMPSIAAALAYVQANADLTKL